MVTRCWLYAKRDRAEERRREADRAHKPVTPGPHHKPGEMKTLKYKGNLRSISLYFKVEITKYG